MDYIESIINILETGFESDSSTLESRAYEKYLQANREAITQRFSDMFDRKPEIREIDLWAAKRIFSYVSKNNRKPNCKALDEMLLRNISKIDFNGCATEILVYFIKSESASFAMFLPFAIPRYRRPQQVVHLLKRACQDKIPLSRSHGNYFANILEKVDVASLAQYNQYFKWFDYIAEYCDQGYSIFEKQFHALTSKRVKYSTPWSTNHFAIFKTLKLCANPEARLRSAKYLLLNKDPKFRNKLVVEFPEFSKLVNVA